MGAKRPIRLVFIYILAWDPALPKFLIATPMRLTGLGRYSAIFAPIKVDPLNLKSQNQAKKIPVVLPCSPIKI